MRVAATMWALSALYFFLAGVAIWKENLNLGVFALGFGIIAFTFAGWFYEGTLRIPEPTYPGPRGTSTQHPEELGWPG